MKILIIDDHSMVNSGLAGILQSKRKYQICGQAHSLDFAMEYMEKGELPSFIILDILLGQDNGLLFLPFLEDFCNRNNAPKPKVLVCSVLEDTFRIHAALKNGASGFICKTGSAEDLLNAIDIIMRGETYISGEHSNRVNKSLGLYAKFTKRELEVFNLIKDNKSNKEISRDLRLNIRTVENHVSNIYLKSGAKNRQELLGCRGISNDTYKRL